MPTLTRSTMLGGRLSTQADAAPLTPALDVPDTVEAFDYLTLRVVLLGMSLMAAMMLFEWFGRSVWQPF
jgi:hypothetical protein